MKPREMNGVVDPNLNVYGVQNLKVADLSIGKLEYLAYVFVPRRANVSFPLPAPTNVGANTYNTALVVG